LSGSDTVDLTTTAATYAETAQLNLYRVLRKLEADNWIEQRGNAWNPAMKPAMLSDASDDSSGGFEIDTDNLLG
jgi:hypothetical protein